MSIAIQRENGDLIWLDAVLSYQRAYSSQISKHPIESGGSIVDNVSQDNPVFSITGIITNADFNDTRPNISPEDAKLYEMSNRQIYNSQPVPTGDVNAPIIGGGPSPMLKYLPRTVTQFLDGQPLSVDVPDFKRPDWVFEVEDILQEMEREHDLVTILEFDGNTVKKAIKECYVTNVTFSETPETGDAFEVSIQLEKVTFVSLRSEVLSGEVIRSFRNKTASKSNKGNVGTSTTEGNAPAKNEDTKFSSTDPGAPISMGVVRNDVTGDVNRDTNR